MVVVGETSPLILGCNLSSIPSLFVSVKPGATSDEVKDDQQVLLSEGELVVPANVVRYHGLGMYENLRREALQGLGEMEAAGQVDYVNDDVKTAQAGMTILDAPNVATSQGIARQQQQYNPALGQFGTATVPQAASSRFVRAPGLYVCSCL